jgi:hypothetical protein
MKAPVAQAGEEAASPLGCASFLFLGPRNGKIFFKKSRILAGSRFSDPEHNAASNFSRRCVNDKVSYTASPTK